VLLLTHYHWDHIQGMPFFTPVYLPQSSIRVYGPEFNGEGPDELLTGQMLAPYFPAPASEWLGLESYHIVIEGQEMAIGSARVCAGRLSHPGLTYGYRIEDQGAVFCYLSDNEPDVTTVEHVTSMVELVKGADLLVHDCQYNETEYLPRKGWGHSTPRQAVEIASRAGVQRLMTFHHDPAHSDEMVEALAEEVRELGGDFEVMIAREGEKISLGPPHLADGSRATPRKKRVSPPARTTSLKRSG
jgi:ribonuclease BN (tRNA processing enzyme)